MRTGSAMHLDDLWAFRWSGGNVMFSLFQYRRPNMSPVPERARRANKWCTGVPKSNLLVYLGAGSPNSKVGKPPAELLCWICVGSWVTAGIYSKHWRLWLRLVWINIVLYQPASQPDSQPASGEDERLHGGWKEELEDRNTYGTGGFPSVIEVDTVPTTRSPTWRARSQN